MELRFIPYNEYISKITDFVSKVALTYGLSEPAADYTAHLANTIKKYFGTLEFEQLESAFELNALGYLNDYLPQKGFSKDNAVKFNIPDICKVLKAYMSYKNLDKEKKQGPAEPTIKQLNESRQSYCNRLEEKFNHYQKTKERSFIAVPIYTCVVLAKLGLIDQKQINYKEKIVNIKFKQKSYIRSINNMNLIFNAFDEVIKSGQTLTHFLQSYRNQYANQMAEMPY